MKTRMLLLPCLSFIMTLVWGNNARAEFVKATALVVLGEVKLTTSDGEVQELTPLSQIAEGSKIETGLNGKVLVRWTEGAFSVLSPNTSLTVVALNTSHYSNLINRQVVLRLLRGTLCDEVDEEPGFTIFRVKSPLGEYTSNASRDRLALNVTLGGAENPFEGEIAVQSGEGQVQPRDDKAFTISGGFQCDISCSGNRDLVKLVSQNSKNIDKALGLVSPKLFSTASSHNDILRLDPYTPSNLIRFPESPVGANRLSTTSVGIDSASENERTFPKVALAK